MRMMTAIWNFLLGDIERRRRLHVSLAALFRQEALLSAATLRRTTNFAGEGSDQRVGRMHLDDQLSEIGCWEEGFIPAPPRRLSLSMIVRAGINPSPETRSRNPRAS